MSGSVADPRFRSRYGRGNRTARLAAADSCSHTAAPEAHAMTLDSPTWTTATESPPAPPAPDPAPRRRRVTDARAVVAAAVLAAVLASGSTFALVEVGLHQTPAPTASTAIPATNTSTTGSKIT